MAEESAHEETGTGTQQTGTRGTGTQRTGAGRTGPEETTSEESAPVPAPGVRKKRGLRYELIGCGLHGHELVGTDAEQVRESDAPLVREPGDGLRWHRCLRCDAWVALRPPQDPQRAVPPEPAEVTLPDRGKILRDRYVLRLIAIDRIVHFVVLAALAIGVFVFVRERGTLSNDYYRFLDALQNSIGGPSGLGDRGMLHTLNSAFGAHDTTLWLIGVAVAAYAALEGVEAIGLWFARRWAEYLTFAATSLLLLPEIYELSEKVSPTKIGTMIVNLAVVIYLLFAKRLFGVRGGGKAEAAEREADTGWKALERVLPATRTQGPSDQSISTTEQ